MSKEIKEWKSTHESGAKRANIVKSDWLGDLFVDYVWSHKKSKKSCGYCNGDYDQEITAIVHRFHSSSDVTQKGIRVKYCPNCGRELY